ncbi:precorrin-6y C5,15-methyltransferase (decarboxylating) subunit CbiE [Allosaccharopolyspora coralli]|uniref:Precorrin-6y C5,15-methyltransferase (Decarboxylating) subunit CbiE n=1 Tax=Allosaccharopolyspora coralli TaxID=2665642 RepID=A0A5Q3Q9C1_9PSEU|nr:bifunctional cobalt-precorrin-7 (C(5))-methyltransferase CbiE/decarboxylating cobalt-precorrin-6B (C(15))-methyltransferase CbiT [Allosaccharopolyspora coralli]QGK70973.1 precorrin-6y C5,15-methyltransferase (decarboxylating) subunit CbiE [Allosaccharopolyspora coralli]
MAVTVIGVVGTTVPDGAVETLDAATLVVGSRALLDGYAPESAKTFETDDLDPALNALAALAGDESGVVLEAGDPGMFGVVGALRERGIRFSVLPAMSSVQRLLAKAGRGWDEVTVVHAGPDGLARAINVCRARRAVAVVTSPGAGPAQLGSGLEGWRRTFVVGEDLGGPNEQLTTVEPAQAAKRAWGQGTVVLCVGEQDGSGVRSWFAGGEPVPPRSGWGLSEGAFSHREGTLLSADVRAVALSRLAPRPGELVWDVGSGAGSVAIECARLGAATVAVEQDEAQVVRMVTNVAEHDVDVRIEEGAAPKALRNLPRPDAVFVGSGGSDVVTACAHAGAQRVVVALATLDRIAPTREALRNAGYEVEGVQLAASRLDELPDGGARLEPSVPIVVLSGTRTAGPSA